MILHKQKDAWRKRSFPLVRVPFTKKDAIVVEEEVVNEIIFKGAETFTADINNVIEVPSEDEMEVDEVCNG